MTEDRAKLATDQVRIVEVSDAQVGLRAGAILEEFEIEALIGRGGVSEVYRARDKVREYLLRVAESGPSDEKVKEEAREYRLR